jgi:hypothetical protein
VSATLARRARYLALLAAPSLALAEAPATRRIEVPGSGALELTVPAGWRFSLAPAPDGSPGFRLDPPQGSAFTLTASIEPLPRGLGAAPRELPGGGAPRGGSSRS